MKHTEGPWILSEYEVRHPITLELRKGCEIFCKDNNRVVCEIPDYHFHAEDVEYQSADAKLITAAPDLISSLRTVVGLLQHKATTPLEIEAIDMAKVAIYQAGGNSQ